MKIDRHVGMMGVTIFLSMLGFLIHNAREFGLVGMLSDPGTFTIPGVLIWAGLFLMWWLIPGARRGASITLLGWALLNLIGGAILSVLPIGLFPFTPEQSVSHYVSHLIYGLLQLPLIGLAWKSVPGR